MRSNSVESQIIETMRKQMKLLTSYKGLTEDHDNLTFAQLGILNIIDDNPGIGVSELASELHVQPAAITQHILKLENEDWIIREHGIKDRRTVNLHISPAKEDLLHKQKERNMKDMKNLLNELTEKEKSDLLLLLRKIEASIRKNIEH